MLIELTLDQISEDYPDLMIADGFDKAILGVTSIVNTFHVLYDTDKCIEILMEEHKMTYEEAIDYFEFNVSCAYVGENTPVFTV